MGGPRIAPGRTILRALWRWRWLELAEPSERRISHLLKCHPIKVSESAMKPVVFYYVSHLVKQKRNRGGGGTDVAVLRTHLREKDTSHVGGIQMARFDPVPCFLFPRVLHSGLVMAAVFSRVTPSSIVPRRVRTRPSEIPSVVLSIGVGRVRPWMFSLSLLKKFALPSVGTHSDTTCGPLKPGRWWGEVTTYPTLPTHVSRELEIAISDTHVTMVPVFSAQSLWHVKPRLKGLLADAKRSSNVLWVVIV